MNGGQPKLTATLSRRTFLGAAAAECAAAGVVTRGARARAIDRRWLAVHEQIESGAIGAVTSASAIVPMDRMGARCCVRFEKNMPGAIADTLDGVLRALPGARPVSIRTADHEATGAFALTCECGGGPRIAIAGVSAATPFTATVRGTAGSIHVSDTAIAVETRGQWRDVRI